MVFRDIKAGDTLYVYDRIAITLNAEKVVNVSAPRIDKSGMNTSMVVDVTIANAVQYTFKDSSETGYAGNLIISGDRANILKEVEAQKANNENQLARVDQLKAELPKLDSIIDALNPEIKAKKVMEDRLSKIEASLERLLNANLKQQTNLSK